jgi:hypothetical protein
VLIGCWGGEGRACGAGACDLIASGRASRDGWVAWKTRTSWVRLGPPEALLDLRPCCRGILPAWSGRLHRAAAAAYFALPRARYGGPKQECLAGDPRPPQSCQVGPSLLRLQPQVESGVGESANVEPLQECQDGVHFHRRHGSERETRKTSPWPAARRRRRAHRRSPAPPVGGRGLPRMRRAVAMPALTASGLQGIFVARPADIRLLSGNLLLDPLDDIRWSHTNVRINVRAPPTADFEPRGITAAACA